MKTVCYRALVLEWQSSLVPLIVRPSERATCQLTGCDKSTAGKPWHMSSINHREQEENPGLRWRSGSRVTVTREVYRAIHYAR